MHIVFIVGSYHPYYSAVGKCAGNIADEMSKSHQVTVLSVKNFPSQLDEEEYKGQKIVRIWTKEKKTRFNLEQKVKTSTAIKKHFYRFGLGVYKASCVLTTIFSRDSLRKELVQSYKQALFRIVAPIDVIIPLCLPFEGIVAAIQYKESQERQTKLVPYLFDQFAENDSLHRFRLNKIFKRKAHRILEKKMIETADSILIMKQLATYYKRQYSTSMGKIYVLEHPLLIQQRNVQIKKEPNFSFIYAGSFYKKNRNPRYMLKLMSIVLGQLSGQINIYSFGNCVAIVNNYARLNDHMIDHGSVSTKYVYEALQESTFLVAVGNKDTKQVASKIFEYFAFGKPIIYFYSNEEDHNLPALKMYPLALCLKQDKQSLGTNVEAVINFCKRNMNKKLEYLEVSRLFEDATPQYTARIIEGIING